MKGLIAKEKEVVVPGEVLATGMDYLPGAGTRRDGDNILATKVGLLFVEGRALKLIPLAGRYVPKRGDTVIAKVFDITMSGWRLEMNCAYSAMVTMRDASNDFIPKDADLRQYFDFGDYVVAKIVKVTTQKLIDLTMKGPGLRKLGPGRVINVNPYKVPRIIGKKGSMVSMVKQATGTRIIVGQNGLIWIQGDDPAKERLAVETIKKIEAESHISGLTDKIKAHLEKITGTKIEEKTEG